MSLLNWRPQEIASERLTRLSLSAGLHVNFLWRRVRVGDLKQVISCAAHPFLFVWPVPTGEGGEDRMRGSPPRASLVAARSSILNIAFAASAFPEAL